MNGGEIFGLAVAGLIGLAVLAGAAWVAWKIVTFLTFGLPKYLSQPGTWTPWLAIVVSLAILPAFTAALLDVGGKAVEGLSGLIRDVLQLVPRSCGPNDYCPSLSSTLNQIYADALAVISGIGIPRDLLLQLPGFIVLAVAINFVLRLLRALLEKDGTGIFGSLVASTAHLGTSKLIVNGLFVVLVLTSMYLSLAALLAVPLMQPQAVVDGFSVEDLEKKLPTDDETRKTLDQRFPAVAFPSLPDNTAEQSTGRLRQALDELALQWTNVRVDVAERIRGLRLRAIEDFRGQNALGFGGKGPVSQYVRTYNWYWSARNTLEAAEEQCLLEINRLVPLIRSYGKQVEIDLDASTQIDFVLANGKQTCDAANSTVNEPLPERTKPGDSLKAVGIWTDWLIGTESMPLVIITGLVGFSLLGASISHLITHGRDPDADDLSLSDFLKVVIKGAVAALTVFLASYGGLAVLGNVPQDPSPYVVFALCLTAAVFSDDVWTWARERLLAPALDGKTEDAPDEPPNEQAPPPDPNAPPQPEMG